MGEADSITSAYQRLVDVIYRRSLALLGSEDEAHDAVQDVLVKLQTHLASYRGEAAVVTWAWRVATNHCLNRLRARRVRRQALQALRELPSDRGSRLDKQLERRDLLRHLLDRMTAQKAQILLQRHVNGLTNAEIATRLGISKRAVRKAIRAVCDEISTNYPALRHEL